jgi:hypothetical protein
VIGAESHLYRSGLLDSAHRFSVNLKGGPALPLKRICKMAAENVDWGKPEGSSADGAV